MMFKQDNKASSGQKSMSSISKHLSEIDIKTLPKNVFFGSVMYDVGGTYGPRIQGQWQLVVIRSGEAIIYIDGIKQHLKQGEVAFLKKGHKEFFEFSKTTKTYHSWCDFHWDFPETMLLLISALPFKTVVSSRIERLIDLGLSLHHDTQALEPALAHLAAATFWEYVSSSDLSEPSNQNARLPEPIKRIQAYIRLNYYRDIRLKQLSEIAFVTPEHLTRLFRKHLSTTPIRYLQNVRVNQGISFLSHTSISVERIAFNCGFKTAAHFSRSVKQHTGQTPSEIRGQHR